MVALLLKPIIGADWAICPYALYRAAGSHSLRPASAYNAPMESAAINWRVKICGLTNPLDGRMAVEAGTGAIGLNFYQRSLRSVSLDQANSIIAVIPSSVAKVGVFVNQSADETNQIASKLQLDAVQLHGDESPELVGQIEVPVIRAIRAAWLDSDSIESSAGRWIEQGAIAVLLDSGSATAYGGSGRLLNWKKLASNISRIRESVPVILAGGLSPDNVAKAIEQCRPSAIDAASGVEKFPGKKDAELTRLLIQNAVF